MEDVGCILDISLMREQKLIYKQSQCEFFGLKAILTKRKGHLGASCRLWLTLG